MAEKLYDQWLWGDLSARRVVVKSRSIVGRRDWLATKNEDEVAALPTFEEAIAWVTS